MPNSVRKYQIFKKTEKDDGIRVPLGPCKLKLDGINIGNTLKDEGTSLKVVSITEEVKTDESSEVKEILELGRIITFETAVIFSNESMSILNLNGNLTNLVKRGKLEIITLDGTTYIELYNVSLIMEPSYTFKENKVNMFKIKVKACKNENGKDINIIFN